MILYQSQLVLADLLNEAGQLKYWLDGAGVLMSITQSGGIPTTLATTTIGRACAEIANFRNKRPLHLMVNNLPARTTTPVHNDAVKNRAGEKAEPGTIERWHLPIKTNSEAYWWDEQDGIQLHFKEGVWYGPLPFWTNHQVINNGSIDRIQLVVDLDDL